MTRKMFKLEFSTDSAGFKDEPGRTDTIAVEIHNILCAVARKAWACETSGSIQDYFGSTIGKWSLDDREGE